MKVGLDHSPLSNAHARRGVGTYTRLLAASLALQPGVEVIDWPSEELVDIIHYPYFDLFFSSLPFKKSQPTVVTIHDVIPLLFPKAYPSGLKGRARLYRQILALKNTKAVITDSEASKRDIAQYLRVPLDKIHVTYLAANPLLQAQSEDEVQKVLKKYQVPAKYLLYVGDINYHKNIPQLIKSLKFLPDDVSLVCVGANFKTQEIPEWHAIEVQVALSDVTERVLFLPDVEELSELGALYSGALAYVQPSLAEGFGLPVLEAMQCQTPVITANNSSLVEITGDHAVMIEPEAEKIGEAIKQVLEWSSTHRQEVIRQAYTWSQTFTWQKTAQATVAVYRSVLA